MSAGLGGIGPVSVRYALQIRELLNVQAIKRMVAEQEAARADAGADRAARIEAIRTQNEVLAEEPVKVDVKTDAPALAGQPAPEAKDPVPTTGQLVDVHA
jgi:hypothetical protein